MAPSSPSCGRRPQRRSSRRSLLPKRTASKARPEMFRLWLATLRVDTLAVVAPLAATLTSAVFVQLSLFFLIGAHSPAVEAQLAAVSYGSSFRGFITVIAVYMIVVGVGLPVVVTQISLGRMLVRLRVQTIGQWRLLGATSWQIRRVMFGELYAITLISTALATVLAIPLAEPATNVVMSMTDYDIIVEPVVGSTALVWSLVIMLTLCTLGALGPARTAARVSPRSARRDDVSSGSRKTRVMALVISGLCLLAAIATAASFLVGSSPAPGTNVLLMNALLVASVATGGTAVLGPIVSLITRPLRDSRRASFFLAGHTAAARVRTSAIVFLAPYIGAALLGGFISGSLTYARAAGLESGTSSLLQGLVFYGPAAAIGLIGALTAVVVRGRPDARGQALLTSAGADRRALLTAPVIETTLYFALAVVLTAVSVVGPAALYALSLARAGSSGALVVSVVPPLIFLILAFILVAGVLVGPARVVGRQSVRESLRTTT
ncbi:ABC transporter permease [Microbacterium sp. JB110]|nr:ABC transporter permease [Microbacterium sp. JB110]